jgi:hypothetical protein
MLVSLTGGQRHHARTMVCFLFAIDPFLRACDETAGDFLRMHGMRVKVQ